MADAMQAAASPVEAAAPSAAVDAAASLRAVQHLVQQRRLAQLRQEQALARAKERARRSDEEEYSSDEDAATAQEETADLESRTRRRVRAGLTTITHAPPDASLVNPLALLVVQQTVAVPKVLGASALTAAAADSFEWSAELTAAATAADAAIDDIDWEMEDAAVAQTPSYALASLHSTATVPTEATTQPIDEEPDWNDEVLFGADEAALQEGVEEEDEEMPPVPASVPEAAAILNKVSVKPAVAAASSSAAAAAPGGALTISFEALSNDQVAEQIKQRKADAKAQKQEEKSQKEAAKGKGKRKSTGDSETAATKRQRKGKEGAGSADEDDADSGLKSTPKKKRVQSLVPAQRLTKASRDLLAHIHHVHIIGLISLIQLQSSPSPALGIMTDELLLARLLSIVLNKCPGIQSRRWVIDPRKGSAWVGAKRDSASSSKKEGITWKASHLTSASATAAASLTSPPPAARPSSPSSVLPPAAQGTIFDRVQKIAYWFRSYFTCHGDRINLPASDKHHPLHAYDTNMHVRMLNELRCTCVRRRIIRAAVKQRGLTQPWRHYKSCLVRQLEHVLDTREGGFQQLTMLFVMILRQVGVLTRLCYGQPAVNYKANIIFPKADEQQQVNDAVREGLGMIMDEGFRGQFGGDEGAASSAVLFTQLLREQSSVRQDPRALQVLNSAVQEPCQCQKPFRPVTFGTLLKAAASESPDDVAAAAAARSQSSPPAAASSSAVVSPIAAAAASSSSFSVEHTPRKSPHFVVSKSEAIEILDSDDDELPCIVTKSPHFAKPASTASTAVKPPLQTVPRDDFFDSPQAAAPAAPAAVAAAAPAKVSRTKRKLDVDPPKRSRAAAASTTTPQMASASASSSTTHARAAKGKKKYAESEDEAPDESEAEANPCTVCGANESLDEAVNPILLCDGCDAAICFCCIDPPLNAQPEEYFCQSCSTKPKAKGNKKSAAADAEDDDDIEMVDAPAAKGKKGTKAPKAKAAPRKSRVKKAVATTDDIDLTNSAPSSPTHSAKAKPKAKPRPRLTKAKSALVTSSPATAAAASGSTAPRLIPDELSDLSDPEYDARAPASSARAAAKAADAAAAANPAASAKKEKLPKKQFFEHGYPLIWAEFYNPEEKRWIHVDVMRRLFDSEGVYEHDGGITWQCVLAVRPSVDGAKHLLTDVTKRYTRKWSNVAAHRVDETWFAHQLRRMTGECAAIDRDLENADQAELSQRHAMGDELPTRVNEFKLHPLFCIDKFVLKFEIIYPSGIEHAKCTFIEKKKATTDAPATDIVHLVYPRSSLYVLHTVDRWRREQRAVKHDEVPYPVKTVRRLVQMSRAQREKKIQQGYDPAEEKSELYGIWQTEPWMPDAATNGVVPKNERGHVDVWGESHIPPGCVHLPHPRIKAACKKLGCDYAEAMTGFDVKGGRSCPRFEGVVVCAEFEEPVMTLYRELERAAVERAEKRRMGAITTNWIKLVRGSIVHTRVMRDVMKGAEHSGLAFVPAAAQPPPSAFVAGGASSAAAPPSSAASSLSSTAYGALATTLHAASIAAAAPLHSRDAPHVHSFSQRSFDLATNAWTSVCACGSRQSVEEM